MAPVTGVFGKSKKKRGFDLKQGLKQKIKRRFVERTDAEVEDEAAKNDPFPGEAPVSDEAKQRFSRVGDEDLVSLKKNRRGKLQRLAARVEQAVKLSARSEILLPEDTGYLEADEGEKTHRITQKGIQDAVDITSASKRFSLDLPQMGPYVSSYSREGRHLLLGGRMGHLAAFDWLTKKLLCEINVSESVHAVQWLHQPTMFAAAQKKWTYVYDTQGIELHCLKALHNVTSLAFLPYHFLLVAGSESGFVHWVDISTGTMVGQLNTKCGRIPFLRANPANGIVLSGHSNGVVRMWSPNSTSNVAELLAHRSTVTDVAIDRGGVHLITAGLDRTIKVWDLRMLRPMQSYSLGRAPTHLALSDMSVLAVTLGAQVEVYRDIISGATDEPYLRHQVAGTVMTAQFCPFEDVLGLAHGNGFDSILVPGSGEANFDSYEVNPLMTSKQRREAEVKMLLNKIQPEMICLRPDQMISHVDTDEFKRKRRYGTQLIAEARKRIGGQQQGKKKGKKK